MQRLTQSLGHKMASVQSAISSNAGFSLTKLQYHYQVGNTKYLPIIAGVQRISETGNDVDRNGLIFLE